MARGLQSRVGMQYRNAWGLLGVLVLSVGCAASTETGAETGARSAGRVQAGERVEYQLDVRAFEPTEELRLFLVPHVDMGAAHEFVLQLARAARVQDLVQRDPEDTLRNVVEGAPDARELSTLRFDLNEEAPEGPFGVYLLGPVDDDGTVGLVFYDLLVDHERRESTQRGIVQETCYEGSSRLEGFCQVLFSPFADKAYTAISLRTGTEWDLVWPESQETATWPRQYVWEETKSPTEMVPNEPVLLELDAADGSLALPVPAGPLMFVRRARGALEPEAVYPINLNTRAFGDHEHGFEDVLLPDEQAPE